MGAQVLVGALLPDGPPHEGALEEIAHLVIVLRRTLMETQVGLLSCAVRVRVPSGADTLLRLRKVPRRVAL